MQAEYDVTPDDLLAFMICHHQQSPVSRRQSRRTLIIGLFILLLLPTLILATSDKPKLETAIAIWPLLMGPVVFFCLLFLVRIWRNSSSIRQILSERQSKFVDHRILSLQPDGLQESMSAGSNLRSWTSIERILCTREHAFVYTSGIEAIVIPRQSFSSSVNYEDFLQEISHRSGVEVHDV